MHVCAFCVLHYAKQKYRVASINKIISTFLANYLTYKPYRLGPGQVANQVPKFVTTELIYNVLL